MKPMKIYYQTLSEVVHVIQEAMGIVMLVDMLDQTRGHWHQGLVKYNGLTEYGGRLLACNSNAGSK